MSHMRNQIDSMTACTGLVQKYIGSAFDHVHAVSNNLDGIKKVVDLIDDKTLEFIVAKYPELKDVLARLINFNNIYYGPLDHVPTTRPDGSPIGAGDLYYNTQLSQLFVNEAGTWDPVGAVENYVEAIPVTIDHFKDSAGNVTADATIKIDSGYNMGLNNMLVFVNATYQSMISNTNPNGAYFEKDAYHIVFPGPGLQVGDKVTVVVGKVVTTMGHTVGVDTQIYQTILPDERVITLPHGMAYNPGLGDLEIFVNGLHQLNGIDYTETDKNTITLVRAVPVGSFICFKKGDIVSSGWAKGYSESFTKIEILNVATDFFARQRTLPADALIILKGYALPSDGGDGIFIYDPTYQRQNANGGTVIDATVALTQQGSGIGSGCWVRQYTGEVKSAWWGLQDSLVSTLPKLGTAKPGDYFIVEGFHAIGDGGQGEFYWDTNEPKRNHDGGTVLNPDAIFPAQWNNSAQMRNWFNHPYLATGCWVRKHLDQANICWFGAIPDGTTDNGFVFEGISRSVADGRLTRLFIPKGTYAIKTPETFLVENFDGEFILYGDHRASKILIQPGAAADPFVFRECHGVIIRDFSYTDNRRVTVTGFSFQNCSDVRVQNMMFTGLNGNTIEFTHNKSTNSGKACNNILIKQNEFYQCGKAGDGVVIVEPMFPSQNAMVIDNWFKGGVGPTQTAIKAGCAMEDCVIRDNEIDGITGNGIVVEGYMNVEIESNTVQNFAGNAIQLRASTVKTFTAPTLEYCGCKSNHISLPKTGSLSGKYGIYIEGDTAAIGLLSVSDNTFVNCAGISCQPQAPLKNILIHDNKVQDVPKNFMGILADDTNGAAPEDIHIEGNFLENEDVTRANALISLQACKRAIVRENYLKRSGDYDIRLQQCEDSYVLDNVFHEPNVNNAAGSACIEISDSRTVSYRIRRNHILTGRIGHPVGLVVATSNIPDIHVTGNTIDDPAVPVAAGANVNFGPSGEDVCGQMGSVRHFYGSAVPSPPNVNGAYGVGDIIWNTSPVASGNIGWVCITAGSPGTWKTFGAVGA